MHRSVAAVIVLGLTACVSDSTPSQQAVDACGPMPSHGDYAVAYESRSGSAIAVMSRSDFDALATERHDLKAWALCVAGL